MIQTAACAYRSSTGACEKPATRKVDSRALDRPDVGLDVCDEHYQAIKAWWLRQATERSQA